MSKESDKTQYLIQAVPPMTNLTWPERVDLPFDHLRLLVLDSREIPMGADIESAKEKLRVYEEIECFGVEDIPEEAGGTIFIDFAMLIGRRVLLVVDHNQKL